jgi:hypothetical protein
MFDNSIIALGLPAIGVIVWLVRLEGRINTNEALQKSVLDEVQYIRRRIDRAINSGHGNNDE